MSYTSIAKAFVDPDLIARVRSAVAKEAFANATLRATVTGQQIVTSGPDMVLPKFLWPVCINTETEYEYALTAAIPDPGLDPGVITDAAIGSTIQANWPVDEELLPRTIFLKVVEAGEIPS